MINITCILRLTVEKGTIKVWWPGFNVQFVSLSGATDSVSSGNLLTFDITGSKTDKIVGDNNVILSPKLRHKSSVAPYSTDNRRNTSSLYKASNRL